MCVHVLAHFACGITNGSTASSWRVSAGYSSAFDVETWWHCISECVVVPRVSYLSIYICLVVACEAGTYGPGCSQTCNCHNNATCDPVDGKCECGAGWTGSSCEQGSVLTVLTQSWEMFILSLIKNIQRFFLLHLSRDIWLTDVTLIEMCIYIIYVTLDHKTSHK